MMHFKGVPKHFGAPPAPLCDLRGTGETTTLIQHVDCPTCRRILRLDGKQWAASKPKEDPRMVPASREFLDDSDDERERYP